MSEPGIFISKIAREANKLAARTLKEEGIGTSEFDFLHVVRKYKGIRQSDICKILGIDKAASTRIAQRLEKKGYIRKEKSEKDLRASLLFATPKAEELKLSKRGVESLYYEYLFSAFNEDEKEIFSSLLSRIYLLSKNESKAGFPHVAEKIKNNE